MNAGSTTTRRPRLTTTTTLAPEGLERTIFLEWAPYIIAAAVIVTVVFLFLCFFCKCFRDGIYWCFTCGGACQCCHYVCCCRERPMQVDAGGQIPVSSVLSQSNSGSRSGVPNYETRLPPVSIHTTPGPSRLPSNAVSNPSRVPSMNQPSGPNRFHLSETARKQKYIGSLLASGRRPLPPLGTQLTTTTAPPAAKQVARTVKIIGDILTTDARRK